MVYSFQVLIYGQVAWGGVDIICLEAPGLDPDGPVSMPNINMHRNDLQQAKYVLDSSWSVECCIA